MPLSDEQLAEAAARLAKRPGHEAVRFETARLLIDGLGARPEDVLFEQALPEVRGRVTPSSDAPSSSSSPTSAAGAPTPNPSSNATSPTARTAPTSAPTSCATAP